MLKREFSFPTVLPKLGAKLYTIALPFFLLPTHVAGLAARPYGFSPQEWRAWAIAVCVVTASCWSRISGSFQNWGQRTGMQKKKWRRQFSPKS